MPFSSAYQSCRQWVRVPVWGFFLAVTACAPNSSPNHVGESVAALESAQGQPVATESIAVHKKARIFRYETGVSYQIEDEKVVAVHRAPAAGEQKIQNWYQMRGAARREAGVALADAAHAPHQEYGSVRFLDLGKTVVYDRSSGDVVKVVEYEAR